MVSMVVISLVFSVVFLLALGLQDDLVASSIVRSLCVAYDFIAFCRALLLRILVDCGFAGVSCTSLPLDAKDSADFADLAVFLILVFCSLCS